MKLAPLPWRTLDRRLDDARWTPREKLPREPACPGGRSFAWECSARHLRGRFLACPRGLGCSRSSRSNATRAARKAAKQRARAASQRTEMTTLVAASWDDFIPTRARAVRHIAVVTTVSTDCAPRAGRACWCAGRPVR